MQIVLEPPFNQVWKTGYLQNHPSGRRYVCLVNTSTDRTIISYARYLMSVKLGDFIPEGYEVDHKDDDRTNDDINNLQVVTEEYNRLKEQYRYTMFEQEHYGFICAYCETPFILTERELKMRLKQSKSGLAFCSHSCSLKAFPVVREADPFLIKEIQRLRSTGLSGYKIADMLNISRNTVMKYW